MILYLLFHAVFLLILGISGKLSGSHGLMVAFWWWGGVGLVIAFWNAFEAAIGLYREKG